MSASLQRVRRSPGTGPGLVCVPLGCPPQRCLVPARGKGGCGLPRHGPPPFLFGSSRAPVASAPPLGRDAGSAQVPHWLHHDHPAAPGEGVWVGGSSCWWRGHPVGWLVLSPPCASRHIPKDASLPCVPRPRGSGWLSTRCGNTARMKRWWPRPKSSSRTGSGCWVSDAGERQDNPLPPVSPNPPRAILAPQTPDALHGVRGGISPELGGAGTSAAVTQSCQAMHGLDGFSKGSFSLWDGAV